MTAPAFPLPFGDAAAWPPLRTAARGLGELDAALFGPDLVAKPIVSRDGAAVVVDLPDVYAATRPQLDHALRAAACLAAAKPRPERGADLD